MSSDGYFEDDSLDGAAFEELDAIEAAVLSQKAPPHNLSLRNPTLSSPDSSVYDLTFDLDEGELQKLDHVIQDAYRTNVQAAAGSSKRTSPKHQTTLFGDILPPPPTKPRSQIQRTKSLPRSTLNQPAPRTKQWDQTAFAKTGLKQGNSKGKRKMSSEDVDNEENVEFEQFPPPFVPGDRVSIKSNTLRTYVYSLIFTLSSPPPPMKLLPDLLEAKHWIYPLNRPKRDYQYNIVKRCLFDNTIVALPTGLGKTFIAGVVMLNYYRWFPEGKVVFVAPTKPLVAQQIDACHQTCGIPGTDAIELTGQVQRATRARAWKAKRVFYMTPQTLVNDLNSENCDPRDIVLLVIDEAHRATGDYAYNQVVRFLMAKNPHHRILALTATPGGSPEAVQKIIDGLHISRIEIRDENSLDLKQYLHHKTIQQHIVNMTEDVIKIRDKLAQLMEVLFKPLQRAGILRGSQNLVNMHPYAAQARMGSLESHQKWAYGPLSQLATLARAMGYLIEGTMGMCHTYLHEVSREPESEPSTGKATTHAKQKKLWNDPLFRAVLGELDPQKTRGFPVHPKMDLLKRLVVQHFGEKLGNNSEGDEDTEQTRVMVFVTFREAVDEIVENLNSERPLIRAHRFIGQGTDKQGKRGQAQKEQLEVIQKFKAGEFNVLVATSIGEEGLDIGEVDMIVCYDAQKTPIRMLQRLGRTGRKRAGFVHVLLSEGREEFNMDKAKVTYKEVQKSIVRGDQLELYTDVARLLPEHIKPECLEKKMDIQEYIREDGRKKGASRTNSRLSPSTGQRKRNDDIHRNIPDGASTGFVSVADLLVKGAKRSKVVPKDFDLAAEDDDVDIDIEAGSVTAPRRTGSIPLASKKGSATSNLRRSKTHVQKRKKRPVEPSSSQFSNKGVDDMDDVDIEQGLILPQNSLTWQSAPQSASGCPSTPRRSPPPSRSPITVIDLSGSEGSAPSHQRAVSHPNDDRGIAWLVDDDGEPDIDIIDSSPILCRLQPSKGMAGSLTVFSPLHHASSHGSISDSPDAGGSTEIPTGPTLVSDNLALSCLPKRRESNTLEARCLPEQSFCLPSEDAPQASFPVRSIPKRKRYHMESPTLEVSQPSHKRLHRGRPERHDSQHLRHDDPRLLLDLAAIHSGDEISEGSSHSDDVEDESDRRFLEELPESQVSPSYDQTLAYRQSLFTQAPVGSRAPVFAKRPIRPGMFRGRVGMPSRSFVSDSPKVDSDEPDEYQMDSFVVEDEADISYLSDSSNDFHPHL